MNSNKNRLNDLINEQVTRPAPRRGEIYRHFSGDYFIVEDIAYDIQRQTPSIIYRAAYGECMLFVRDLNKFLEILPSGEPRFTKVESIPDKKESSTNNNNKDIEVYRCPYCGYESKYDLNKLKLMIHKLPLKPDLEVETNICCKKCNMEFLKVKFKI